MGIWRWVASTVVLITIGGAIEGHTEVSILNISPGFPTQLDDAYPINPGAFAIQPAVRFDKRRDDNGRLQQTVDARWSPVRNLELFAGGSVLHGPLLPGAIDDVQAVRAGGLYRILHQQDFNMLVPSVAVRMTVQVPFSGPEHIPALRNEVMTSWDLSSGWYGHVNGGYQLVPGDRLGLHTTGRRSVWFARGGIVKAIREDFGIVASMSYGQDPTRTTGYLFTPELGVMWSVGKHWFVTAGGGRDIGGSDTQNQIRGNIAVSWVWW